METPTSTHPDNLKGNTPPRSLLTNWTVSQGFLEASVAVDSSEFPIIESGSLCPTSKPPLVLKGSNTLVHNLDRAKLKVYAIGGFFILRWALARWKERRARKPPSDEPSSEDPPTNP